MASHRSEPGSEYDSDDMSAGARLMRYYVSDEPSSDTLGERSNSTDETETQQSANVSGEQNMSTNKRVPRSTGKPECTAESSAKPRSKNNKETEDDDDDIEHNNSDDAVFRGDLADFKGDVLFDIVGRYSHHYILERIAKFQPQANFGQKQLTWKIANTIVARAHRQGVTKSKVRAELDAMRIANGVEFPSNYRPKGQGQQGEPDGKEGDDDDGIL